VYVRENKVVRTQPREFPDPSYNRICIRGLTYPFRIYSEHRVKYPLKRVGERGSGEWEQISWDEAFDEIGEKWRGYISEYGNTSVAQLFGTGSYTVVNGSGAYSVVNRFENVTGISEILPVFDSGSSYTLS
jgi:molybdopterin-containing oxidoreductase family molybdopterin binding subunit